VLSYSSSLQALRIFLQAGYAADRAGMEAICYEFFTQAFTIYEEQIADEKRRTALMSLIIGTLQVTIAGYTLSPP